MKRQFKPVAAVVCAALLGLSANAALAEDLLSPRDRIWFGSLVAGQWTNSRLPEFPYDVVTGKLDFDDAHMLSARLSRVVIPDFSIPLPLTDARLTGNSVEIEAQLAQHFGKQSHQEVILAATLRSGEIALWDDASVNIAWANGLSYALSDPALEKGSSGIPGIGSRNLQYYLGLESEWSLHELSRVHFLIHLHHRSGIYGLISPQKTGSNYLGAGFSFDFE